MWPVLLDGTGRDDDGGAIAVELSNLAPRMFLPRGTTHLTSLVEFSHGDTGHGASQTRGLTQ